MDNLTYSLLILLGFALVLLGVVMYDNHLRNKVIQTQR